MANECSAKDLLSSFRREFSNESDRSCVILSAAMIENELEKIIRLKLVASDDSNDFMFSDGPFSSFGNKIDAAFSLGLISKSFRRDLHILRKMRNQFAHEIYNCDFNNDKIKNRVLELSKSTGIIERHKDKLVIFGDDSRGHFQMILSQMLFILRSGRFIANIEKLEESKEEWIYGNR